MTVVALFYWPFASAARTIKDKVVRQQLQLGSLACSLSLSAIAFVLRPTNVIFWVMMGGELVWRHGTRRPTNAGRIIGLAVIIG